MKRIISIVVSLAVITSSHIFVLAENGGTEYPSYIDIGNTASEGSYIEYTSASEPQTNTIDDMNFTYRTLGADGVNGSMTFTMSCDGEKTNYLTVKLWGSDTGDTMLWLTDENGNMSVSGSNAPIRNGRVDGRDWVELNFLRSSPQYEGGFIYSTYIIPRVYTDGKTSVTLKISSTGGNADYASDGNTVKTQTMPSRGIYALYMTQDADFIPENHETVKGQLAKTADANAPSYNEQKATMGEYAKNAVETFKSWQIYKKEDKNYPSYMEGMITRTSDWQSKSADDTDWKDAYYSRMLRQNLTPLDGYEIFALAYKNADVLGYDTDEKAELLDRVVKGIDFLVRAQGANGGFNSSDGKWIGGPERRDASGSALTGFGLRSVAYALDVMYNDIESDGSYLTKYIDSDADGAVETNRRRKAAWEEMAADARDFLTSLDGAGHAPNQDMADIIAALRFNNALAKMNSSRVWSEEEVINQLDMALGFKTNLACSSYWVSPKGIILENFGSIQGGYSGDYGINALEEMSQLTEIAVNYLGTDGAKKYTDRLKDAYEVSSQFMFSANASAGSNPTLYSEGLTSNRNAYYPGTERYVLDEFAALGIENKTALKAFETFLDHNRLINAPDSAYMPSSVHYEDNILSVMRMYLNFDEIISKFDTSYNYLMEDDSVDEYAWADEMAREVVIKNGDDRIYLALNWRNPLRSVEYYNTETTKDRQAGLMNNLARVHHKTSRYDKYGYAELETVGWDVKTGVNDVYKRFENHYAEAFMYMNYGNYAIIMNSNNLMGAEKNVSYDIPYEELGLDGLYKDLISGVSYYFVEAADGATDGTAAKIAPASTMVLYKTLPEGEAQISAVTYADNTVTVTALANEGESAPVNVYTAEYNGDMLVNVKSKRQTITGNGEIKFTYEKQNAADTVKIFVWDNTMKPLYNAKEW